MRASPNILRSLLRLSRLRIREALMMLIVAGILFSISPLSATDTARHGTDPLSDAEINLVLGVAIPASTATTIDESSTVPPSSDVAIDPASDPAMRSTNEPLLLLVERRLAEKDHSEADRLADVYSYDYSDNSLIHMIVEVDTGRVRVREVLHNTQLPLVDSEIQRAAAIVMSNPATRERLEQAFRKVTGIQLNDITDIEFKAFVFHADTLPAESTSDSAMCGFHRCAQMITYTRDNVSLDVSPIIDLSDGRVTQISAP